MKGDKTEEEEEVATEQHQEKENEKEKVHCCAESVMKLPKSNRVEDCITNSM